MASWSVQYSSIPNTGSLTLYSLSKYCTKACFPRVIIILKLYVDPQRKSRHLFCSFSHAKDTFTSAALTSQIFQLHHCMERVNAMMPRCEGVYLEDSFDTHLNFTGLRKVAFPEIRLSKVSTLYRHCEAYGHFTALKSCENYPRSPITKDTVRSLSVMETWGHWTRPEGSSM